MLMLHGAGPESPCERAAARARLGGDLPNPASFEKRGFGGVPRTGCGAVAPPAQQRRCARDGTWNCESSPQFMNMDRHTSATESERNGRSAALPVRVAARRGTSMIAYTAIFASALSGYAGVGLWAIPLTAIALASLSYAEYGGLYRRGKELGLISVVNSTLLQSACNALMATAIAYAVGLLFRLMS